MPKDKKIKNKLVLRYHKRVIYEKENREYLIEYNVVYYNFNKLYSYGDEYRLICDSHIYYFEKPLYEIIEITLY